MLTVMALSKQYPIATKFGRNEGIHYPDYSTKIQMQKVGVCREN
jgi:hypothetical protein